MLLKPIFCLLTLFLACTPAPSSAIATPHTTTSINYLTVAKQLVQAAKDKTPYKDLQQQLAEADRKALLQQLNNDNARKAFWINVYNAHIQFFLTEKPELIEKKGAFFGNKRMTIAGQSLSFDDMEHGIIRSSYPKLSLGLFRKWFVGKFERQFRVKKRDGRIHFALNCGAKSCPPVAIYELARLDEQLDKASQLHLEKTSEYKEEENTVYVTTLFSWFRGDFGRKKGVKKFLKRYDIIPKDSNPNLQFTKYDWTLDLDNYIEL